MLGTLTSATRLAPGWWPSLLPGRLRDQAFVPTIVRELGGHESRAVLAAAASLGRFTSRSWVGELAKPAVVVATLHDGLVPLHRQRKLAASLAAPVVELAGNHFVAHNAPVALASAILDAVDLLPRRLRATRRSSAA
jgi:hypothetical protein